MLIREFLGLTAADEVLLLMDLQPSFPAANDGLLHYFVEQEIIRAKRLGMWIIALEYDAYELGHTLPRFLALLEGYDRFFQIDRRPPRKDTDPGFLRDDGSAEVMTACIKRSMWMEDFRVVGVNSDSCVCATVRGLVTRLPTCHITVVQDACNSTNGRDTSVFHDVFPTLPNVTVIPHGQTQYDEAA